MLSTLPGHATAEITTFSDVIVVYKFLGDLMFYVTGAQDENELILYQVLQGFYESISLLLRCVAPAHPKAGSCCLTACQHTGLLAWPASKPAHQGGDLLCCLPCSLLKGRHKRVKWYA